jgi:hypothetical protein
MPRPFVSHVQTYDFAALQAGEGGALDAVAAAATITFTGGQNASDGDTLIINDGFGTQVVFEFDSNSVILKNRVAVPIGINAAATRTNLQNVIATTNLNVTPSNTTGGGDPQVTVTHNDLGAKYNGTPLDTTGTTAPDTTAFAGGVSLDPNRSPLMFLASRGGLVQMRFEGIGSAAIAVTVQVSADGKTWANTSAAANVQAIVSESIAPSQHKNFEINLRAGLDNYVRVIAVGGDRGQVQVRSEVELEVVRL